MSNFTVSVFRYHCLCPLRTAKNYKNTYFGHLHDDREKNKTVEISAVSHSSFFACLYGPKTSLLKTIFSQKFYNNLTGPSVSEKQFYCACHECFPADVLKRNYLGYRAYIGDSLSYLDNLLSMHNII